jgi:hypothetical protein
MLWKQKQWGQSEWGQSEGGVPPVVTEVLAADLIEIGQDITESTGPVGLQMVVPFMWPAFRKKRPQSSPPVLKFVVIKKVTV